MAISEYSPARSRKRIAFVREQPSKYTKSIFRQRGFECIPINIEDLSRKGFVDAIDSVIITQHPDKPSHFWQDLSLFSQMLNHDCRMYVRHAVDVNSRAFVVNTINKLGLPPSLFATADSTLFSKEVFDPLLPFFAPFVHILTADVSWHQVANLIVANPAGHPPNTGLEIDFRHEVSQCAVPDERNLLLQRAFSDCLSIELNPKTNGLSGVDAFEAFAHLTNVVGSNAPYRCFVKIGPRLKVAREFEKYRSTALENVPFHLGPRIRADRCVLGKSLGLITSDYVSGAETLRDCIRDGRAVHVIGNLFNQTLISWRRGATDEKRPLQEFLNELLIGRCTPVHRKALITAFGATKSFEELLVLIANSPPSKPVLSGIIHGDLHATNVLVRMSDAIIIDLERIAAGQPLLIDAASLEGGLFVDGFIGDRRSADQVLKSILPLYSIEALEQDDHYCHPADGSAWFVDSVRQIRMQARQMQRQPFQYGWTLAAVLLKKATNPQDFTEESSGSDTHQVKLSREAVRAIAFVVAERIIAGLSEVQG